jgi:hypothetical protein
MKFLLFNFSEELRDLEAYEHGGGKDVPHARPSSR